MRFMLRSVLGFLLVALLVPGAKGQENLSLPYEFVLAKLAAEGGRFDEAIRHIDRVVESDPRNIILLYERASILLEASKIDRAESELRKLVTIEPKFYDGRRMLGRLLLDRSGGARGKVEEALVHLREALRLFPDDFPTGMTVAQILVNLGQTAEAERVLADLLERSPDQRSINYNYAQVLTKLGRGDESKEHLERALAADPTFAPAVFQLIDLYQEEREWKKAADVLDPLIEQDPVNLDLQRQQGFFYLRSGQAEKARDRFKALLAADPKDERSLFYLAEAFGDLNEYHEADLLYRRLLEKAPNDPELLVSFGLSQIGQSKYDDAAMTFNTLLSLPSLPENIRLLARTQLAMIDHQKKDYDSAVRRAREVLVSRGQPNMQAINIAVDSLRRQKKYAEASALLQPLVKEFGTNPTINARYVELLTRTGEKEKAKSIAEIQANKGPRAGAAVAEAYVQAGAFDEGIALLQRLLKKDAQDTDLLFQLGSAYERGGRIAEAERTFLSVLEQIPDHSPTLNYLGYMWADRGMNLERAAEMLLRAVSREPRNGAYLDSLGWVYFRQGKLELAEKNLMEAARILPTDPTVQEHLGDLFTRQRSYQSALDRYQKALGLEPEDEAKLRSKIAETEKLTHQE